jgi:hypothetical protein
MLHLPHVVVLLLLIGVLLPLLRGFLLLLGGHHLCLHLQMGFLLQRGFLCPVVVGLAVCIPKVGQLIGLAV